jgi:hypothetical protein
VEGKIRKAVPSGFYLLWSLLILFYFRWGSKGGGELFLPKFLSLVQSEDHYWFWRQNIEGKSFFRKTKSKRFCLFQRPPPEPGVKEEVEDDNKIICVSIADDFVLKQVRTQQCDRSVKFFESLNNFEE